METYFAGTQKSSIFLTSLPLDNVVSRVSEKKTTSLANQEVNDGRQVKELGLGPRNAIHFTVRCRLAATVLVEEVREHVASFGSVNQERPRAERGDPLKHPTSGLKQNNIPKLDDFWVPEN